MTSSPDVVVTKAVSSPVDQTLSNRAMWLLEPGKFELKRQEIDPVGPDEVLLRLAFAGICPWDVRVYAGKKSVPIPRLMGHEASGIVVHVGERVTDIQVGQRIVGDFIVKCGVCPACRSGRSNRCQHPRFPNGAYEDYAVLPRQNIHLIQKPDTSYRAAAFMEPLACVARGQKMLRLSPGETEVIVGAGPIGLLHMQVARYYGARTMVIDPLAERLELASSLGADAVFDNSGQPMKPAVMEWTGGRGADAAVVTVGVSPVVVETAECMADGGRLNIFAGIYPVAPLAIDPNVIHYRELVVTGLGGLHPRRHAPGAGVHRIGPRAGGAVDLAHFAARAAGGGLRDCAQPAGTQGDGRNRRRFSVMGETPYALAVDVGTSSLKAVVYGAAGGVLGSATRRYSYRADRPGWAESDPEDWWQAFEGAVGDLVSGGLPLGELRGLAFTGQMHTAVLLDESGTPLPPTILWLDRRAGAETAELTAALELPPWQLNSTYTLPKLALAEPALPRRDLPYAHAALAQGLSALPADRGDLHRPDRTGWRRPA